MTVALMLASRGRESPLSHLLVSDIAPTRTALSDDFIKYIDAMREVNALPLGAMRTRTDVDLWLQKYESVSIPLSAFVVLVLKPLLGFSHPSISLDESHATKLAAKPRQTSLQSPSRYSQEGHLRPRLISLRCCRPRATTMEWKDPRFPRSQKLVRRHNITYKPSVSTSLSGTLPMATKKPSEISSLI